jgi:hypothetical protein
LCVWFRRLGNLCLVRKILDFVVEVSYLALFSAGLFGCPLWGMLFVGVSKGKRWLVGLRGFGLCVGYSCMGGNTTKDICDSRVGIRNMCCVVGVRAGLRMTIMMVDVSGMCG